MPSSSSLRKRIKKVNSQETLVGFEESNKNNQRNKKTKQVKMENMAAVESTPISRMRSASDSSSFHQLILPEAVKQAADMIPTSELQCDSKQATDGTHAKSSFLENVRRYPLSWSLAVVTTGLTFHSLYFLIQRMNAEFDLEKCERWEAIAVVWCSGWITAATTGIGAFPFICVQEMSEKWLAISNAFAAGMMLAASTGLVIEGIMESTDPNTLLTPTVRLGIGFWIGVLFILASKKLLDQYEDIKMLELDSLTAKRVLLIIAVMTLHSFSEGVGIGVSYNSQSLGAFISATLAIHNIPEGLAVSIVLIPRGISVLQTSLWCVATSLPQPLMAVPAYLFVEEFQFILPIGLGFAAGAMGFVAIFELFMEAQEVLSVKYAILITSFAFVCMAAIQFSMHEASI